MAYSDDFIASLRTDPMKGALKICDAALAEIAQSEGWGAHDLEVLTEAAALILELIDTGLVSTTVLPPALRGEMAADGNEMASYLRDVHAELTGKAAVQMMSSLRSRFKNALTDGFIYEFTQGDLDRIQELISELRANIRDSPLFEENHRQRLLARLERLQGEMHKKMSDLDRLWSIVGDAGVVLGKFGKDAKPLVDRFNEICRIGWQTQARAEELPSGMEPPMIGHDKISEPSKD